MGILLDCSADYNKTSTVVARCREALELFRGAISRGEGGGDHGMKQLLREQNAIDNYMKSVLTQTSSMRSELRRESAGLKGVTGTISAIARNILMLKGLIDRIWKKSLKDDQVVSGVVTTCILSTLWYLFARGGGV